MNKDTKNWLQLAQEDYQISQDLLSMARYAYVIYFLGQALEKLLKSARLEIRNSTPEKTHNLRTLAINSGITFTKSQITDFVDLGKHYGRVRYRDLSQAHYNTKAKTESIIKKGQKMYQWILTKLEIA